MSRQFPALSGLAMVLIVLNHTIQLGTELPVEWGYTTVQGWARTGLSLLQALGSVGVPIFLFISGVFMAYAARGNPPRVSSSFLWRSLLHILVPYLIWSVVFYLLIYVQGQQYTAAEYLKSLLVGYPFHFIPLLVFFYLLSPLLVVVAYRHPAALVGLTGLFQLVLINLLHPGILGFTFPQAMSILEVPVLRNSLASWAVYFPLGLVYFYHSRYLLARMQRLRPALLVATVVFFTMAALPRDLLPLGRLARYLYPFTFVLLLPTIQRDQIPAARVLERIGKRVYGIYLTHLIVLDLVLIAISGLAPWLFDWPVLLFPLLFIAALGIPLALMNGMARSPTRPAYRYVFG